MTKVFTFLVLTVAFSQMANAQLDPVESNQEYEVNRHWMVSFGVGASAYDGDLQGVIGSNHSVRFGPSTLFGIRKKINSRFSLKLNLMYYQIFGDDRDNNGSNRARNLNFRANNTELSAIGIYNIIKRNGNYSINRPQFSPYILFGIGRSTNSPKTFLPNDEGNYSVNLWEYQTEAGAPVDGYPREVTVLPIGFGLRLKVHKHIDLIAEGSRRFTFTDYLDDVAGVYATRDEIIDWNGGAGSENANIAVQLYDRSVEGGFRPIRAGRVRGSNNNDGYFIFTLGIEIYLQKAKLQKSFKPQGKKN